MIHKIKYTTLTLLILFLYQNMYAQTGINKDWKINFGTPDTIDIVETVIDFQGNLITTGNTLVSGQNANVLITKYDKDGNTLWQRNFNYSGASKDYGTCITTDNNGNIYIAGTSFTNYYHATDYLILKYDTAGNLIWSQTYNEGAYTIDIPSDIQLDNNNNIIITGASANLSTNEDFLTIKLNNNGNITWHSTYDYSNLNDRPIGLIIDNQNNIIVTGNSDSNSNNCDITTIKYDGNNGNELYVNRNAQICIGFDKPASIKKDNNNNIYITGYVANTLEGYNIKTIKFDNNLNIIWQKTYNGINLDDKALSMDVNTFGDVIISGYTSFFDIYSLHEQIKFAFDNNVCIVSARDNSNSSSYANVTANRYPACFNDNMVISVGASDTSGNWNNGGDGYYSMYGGKGSVDVIAPGVKSLIRTLDNYGGTSYFNGTSAATPHVAGTIGLMLSYFNVGKPNNEHLSPEDAEFLLQYTAVDKDITGPDIKTGYGLIDATEVMKHLNPSNYTIIHPIVSNIQSSFNNSISNFNIDYNYTNNSGINIDSGNYNVDIYKITAVGNNLNLGFVGNNYDVIDAWPLQSSSIGFRYLNSFIELYNFDDDVIIDNTDLQNQSLFTSYYYHLNYDNTNNTIIDKWIPCHPDSAKINYSVYLKNRASGVENISDNNSFIIYPNPTNSYINIRFNKKLNKSIRLTMSDITGKIVLIKNLNANSNNLRIDISNLEPSYYMINFEYENKSYNKKIIKL